MALIKFVYNNTRIQLINDKIILGIDPGTIIMGYGLILVKGNKAELINMGVLHLSKLNSHELKLKKIFERTLQLVEEYKPDEFAVEAPFFGKNVQSMLKLGRAQGVAMAAALNVTEPSSTGIGGKRVRGKGEW